MMRVCQGCSRQFDHATGDILKYKNSGYYCTECAKTALTVCGTCKGRRLEVFPWYNGTEICRECIDNVSGSIDQCGTCKTYHNLRMSKAQVDEYSPHIKRSTCPVCYERITKNLEPNKQGKCFCGTPTYMKEKVDGKHVYVCKKHKGTLYHCVECGNIHSLDNIHYPTQESRQSRVCEQCAIKHNYFRCNMCGAYHRGANKASNDALVCKQCAKNIIDCPKCKRAMDKRKGIVVHDGEEAQTVCIHCARQYKKCPVCKQRRRLVISTLDGSVACADCRHEKGLASLHGWRYRPEPFILYGKSRLYLGLENEFSVGSKDRERAMAHIASNFHDDILYLQHDGTVHNGAEVVTHPMTYELLRKDAHGFKNMFHKDMVPHKSCGMHIHMSKDAFTPMHLYKFMNFLSNNPRFTEFIAERKGGDAKQWLLTHPELLMEKAQGKSIDPHKYVDINLQHPKSVEIRIFAGVTTYAGLMKNVEFCVALHEFAGQATKIKSAKTEEFVKFVRNLKTKYAYLWDIISKAPKNVTENYCPDRKKPRKRQEDIREGSIVRVNPDIPMNSLQFGGDEDVTYDSVGEVTRVFSQGSRGRELRVDFPDFSNFAVLDTELILN